MEEDNDDDDDEEEEEASPNLEFSAASFVALLVSGVSAAEAAAPI